MPVLNKQEGIMKSLMLRGLADARTIKVALVVLSMLALVIAGGAPTSPGGP
jgi:hypothetical protein